MAQSNANPVRIPGGAYSADDDLSAPVVQLLQDIHVLGTEADYKASGKWSTVFSGTPDSITVLEAGTTAAARGWTTLIGLAGGAAAVGGFLSTFWTRENDPVRVALAAGAAVILAAAAIAIGLIVSADIRGRADASMAEYRARSQVVSTFLGLSRWPDSVLAGAASGVRIIGPMGDQKGRRKNSNAGYQPITQIGIRVADNRVVLKVGDEWIAEEDLDRVPVRGPVPSQVS